MKLGDMTIREYKNLCIQHRERGSGCLKCPFNGILCGYGLSYWPHELSEDLLEQKVKVKVKVK